MTAFLISCDSGKSENEKLEFKSDRLGVMEMKVARLAGTIPAIPAAYTDCEPQRFTKIETSVGALLARCNATWVGSSGNQVKVDIINPLSVRVALENIRVEWMPNKQANRVEGSGMVAGELSSLIVIEPAATINTVVMIPAKMPEDPINVSITLLAALAIK